MTIAIGGPQSPTWLTRSTLSSRAEDAGGYPRSRSTVGARRKLLAHVGRCKVEKHLARRSRGLFHSYQTSVIHACQLATPTACCKSHDDRLMLMKPDPRFSFRPLFARSPLCGRKYFARYHEDLHAIALHIETRRCTGNQRRWLVSLGSRRAGRFPSPVTSARASPKIFPSLSVGLSNACCDIHRRDRVLYTQKARPPLARPLDNNMRLLGLSRVANLWIRSLLLLATGARVTCEDTCMMPPSRVRTRGLNPGGSHCGVGWMRL